MAINSVRTALQLMTGAGELTRAKALEAAAILAELPGVGETTTRVSQLADELFDAASANQQLVEDLVRKEVDRQLERVGLARAGDLDEARRKIEELDAQVSALREQLAASSGTDPAAAAQAAQAAKAPASRAAIKKAAKKPPAAVGGTAKKSSPRAAQAKKAAKKSTRPRPS